MRLLAIDPGPKFSAYVIWDGTAILEHGKVPSDELLRFEAGKMLDACAIEMIACYGMPVGEEVFETCVWIGRYIERWRSYTCNLPHRLITRGAVKMHLCHTMKAKDANIRQALIDRLGAPGTKKAPGATFGLAGDEWAALAVAITTWDALPWPGEMR